MAKLVLWKNNYDERGKSLVTVVEHAAVAEDNGIPLV